MTTTLTTQTRNFVGGDWADGVSTFDNISPVDGSLVSQVHEAGAGEAVV